MSGVLVTGAAGFVGGHMLARLACAEEGRRVVAGLRPGGSALADPDVPAAAAVLDLTDRRTVAEALEGLDAIVHCAVGGPEVTVDGTALLLEEARRAGVRRVVHLSSIAVHGSLGGPVAEDAPTISAGRGDYAAMKVAAEDLCREAAAAGLEVAILRPTIVTGPGSQLWGGKMGRRLAGGRWGTFGAAGEGTCNPVDVTDLAEAVALALSKPLPSCGEGALLTCCVDGRDPLSWNDYFRRLNGAMGHPPLRRIGRRALLLRMALGLPGKALVRLLPGAGRRLAPLLEAVPARSELILFALAATYESRRAEAVLGWRPRVTADQTIASMAEDLYDRGISR